MDATGIFLLEFKETGCVGYIIKLLLEKRLSE